MLIPSLPCTIQDKRPSLTTQRLKIEPLQLQLVFLVKIYLSIGLSYLNYSQSIDQKTRFSTAQKISCRKLPLDLLNKGRPTPFQTCRVLGFNWKRSCSIGNAFWKKVITIKLFVWNLFDWSLKKTLTNLISTPDCWNIFQNLINPRKEDLTSSFHP
jgi:hypothetical protein